MNGPSAKPIVEQLFSIAKRKMVARSGGLGSLRRDFRRFVPRAVRSVDPIVRMITETREVFEVDGDFMQVEHRLPSARGPHHDVVLVRSYEAPTWKRNPYLQAIQVQALERMVEKEEVSFPMGLSQTASAFTTSWSESELPPSPHSCGAATRN